MRTHTSKWFETIVRYGKTMDDGQEKMVNEVYTVDALTFGEAEKRITEEMTPQVNGDFTVKNINPAPYSEVFFTDNNNDDRWYNAKVAFITIDEKTEKEKQTTVTYLVQSNTVDNAKRNIDEVFNNSVTSYVVKSIVESKVMDVFEHTK